MEENNSGKIDKSLDVIGIGKAAQAIPKEVYVEATKGLIETFTKIVSPITEITSGIGRYISQKFDNMVDFEKAMGAFSIQNAIAKAQQTGKVQSPKHLKSFVNSFEEASRETDPILHEMWENILASQITDSDFHPRYVSILENLSVDEANLLMKLNPIDKIGKDISGYLSFARDGFDNFIFSNNDTEFENWNYSCNVLIDLGLAEVIASTKHEKNDKLTILYLTNSGKRFLDSVTIK